MKKSILALFSLCLLAISCKKDDADPVAPNDKPYTNINSGSRFTYEVITDPGAGQTSVIDTVTVSSIDTTVAAGTPDQRVYRILNHTTGANTYQNQSGNDYYQFQNVANTGNPVQLLYLKDNVAANGTWSQDLTLDLMGLPITLTLTSTITEKGISKTVKGITYNDVINVKTVVTSSGLPPGSIVSDIRNSYSRNVGLIQGDYNIDVALAGLSIHNQTLLESADLR